MDIKAKGCTTYQGAQARIAKVRDILKPQDRTFVIAQPSQTTPGALEYHGCVLLTPDRTFMATAFINIGNLHVLG
jgi:hypothetical protein